MPQIKATVTLVTVGRPIPTGFGLTATPARGGRGSWGTQNTAVLMGPNTSSTTNQRRYASKRDMRQTSTQSRVDYDLLKDSKKNWGWKMVSHIPEAVCWSPDANYSNRVTSFPRIGFSLCR